MIIEAQLIKQTLKAKLLKFKVKEFEVVKWVPNGCIRDIEHHFETMESFEVDIADWFCIKNDWDKV